MGRHFFYMEYGVEFIRKVCPSLMLAIIVGMCGYWMGEHKAITGAEQPQYPFRAVQMGRFQPIEDGKAFDTKTGQTCLPYNDAMEHAKGLPAGLTLDGSCAALEKQ